MRRHRERGKQRSIQHDPLTATKMVNKLLGQGVEVTRATKSFTTSAGLIYPEGSFVVSMAALAVLGASDAVSVVIRMTLVQIETPDEMRGRVNAVNSLFAGTSNQLGDFRAGVMAAWLGAIPAVLVGGVGILAVVLVWMRVFPALKHVDGYYATKS